MSEQKATPKNNRGTRRATQAVAGVAGAAACLAIGWAVGARSAGTHATASRAATAPRLTQPNYAMIPGGDDEDPGVQWGTVPVTGLTPAQPGTGIVPPSTGSGGSAVAATTVTTNAVAPMTTAVSSTTPTGTAGVRP